MTGHDQWASEQAELEIERAKEREWQHAEETAAGLIRNWIFTRRYPSQAPQWERDIDAAQDILKRVSIGLDETLMAFAEEYGAGALLRVIDRALHSQAAQKPIETHEAPDIDADLVLGDHPF